MIDLWNIPHLPPAYDLRQWSHAFIGPYPVRGTLPSPPEGFQMARSCLGPGDHLEMLSGLPNLRRDFRVGTAAATVFIRGNVTTKMLLVSHGTQYTASQRGHRRAWNANSQR
jgi:hypothetical protein